MRTAVFDTISALRPFFFSLREIKENISLDIKIPSRWKYDFIIDETQIQIKVQDENDRNKLVSIIGLATKEGYDGVFIIAKKIIKNNQEEEEKIKLFNDKVEELKALFLNSSLDKLKDISFKPSKNVLRDTESARKIELGDAEGSDANGSN
jgi:hypothetical protein